MPLLNKVTVLGDSLVLPRPGDGILIDDIYSTKLAALHNIVVFNKGRVSADTSMFLENRSLFYDIRYSNSQFFVLHLGICDCAPRLFTKKEKKLLAVLSNIPVFSRVINNYIASKSKQRMFHTKKRTIVNVPLDIFKNNYINIIKEVIEFNPVKKIFLVNIAAPGEYLVKRSYSIQSLIKSYNEVIYDISNQYSSITELIDVNSFTKKNVAVVLSDGHHINKKVHDFIYKNIADSILNLCV